MNDVQKMDTVVQAESAGKRKLPLVLAELFFSHRTVWLVVLAVVTIVLGYYATQIRPQAGFEKMVPLKHPYIQNFLANKDAVQGGNVIRLSMETKDGGDIFNDEYIQALRRVSKEVFFLPGADRVRLKSLWTKNVQWIALTEEGFEGGIMIPDSYDGSQASVDQVKNNVMRSAYIGRLVANDFKSSVIQLPLLELHPDTGEKLDYKVFSDSLENIRVEMAKEGYTIHITGVAKRLGDMIDGMKSIVAFFGIAFLITCLLLYSYCRDGRAAAALVICSLVAVVWQLGIMTALGYGLDPYSVLVPFLIFAIGVSHGIQMVNTIVLKVGAGETLNNACRIAFVALFAPAIAALLSDAVGFSALLFIEIRVMQELAIAASVGVAAIIFSNMILLPMLIPMLGLSQSGIEYANARKERKSRLAGRFAAFSRPKPAAMMIVIALVLVGVGYWGNQDLKIGDLDMGAPELRPDSRYNKDVAFIAENYSASSDVMVFMVRAPVGQVIDYKILDEMDRLQWELQNLEGVQSSISAANIAKFMSSMLNEGNPKWFNLSRDQAFLNNTVSSVPEELMTDDADLLNIVVFLDDHKAETLNRVTDHVENFIAENTRENVDFLMAAGNAGIEAATNQSIEHSQIFILIFVYAVVSIMVLLTFRSIKALICIIIPLGLTSLLCQALMAWLGIGVKVATLPVIALWVGIGVDYGIYIFSKLKNYLEKGVQLDEAYALTLQTTGRAVTLTGLTFAVGVCTWVFSPLKFQADMGILLVFMFLLNMLGCLTLLPALAHYLYRGKNATQLEEQAPSIEGAELAN